MDADRIGVVGLGNMGMALATRLAEIVPEVRVFDLRADAMATAQGRGAVPSTSVADLASEVDVVIAALPSPEVSLAVAKELGGDSSVAVFVETSTVGLGCIEQLRSVLDGVELLDCPLSGGPRGVEAGTVSALLAGSPLARARVAPWLDLLLGTKVIVGDAPGGAQVAKLVNNAISLSGLAIACEAIAVGVALGVETHVLLSAVNASTGANSATRDKIPTSVVTRRFDFGGPIALAEKDLELYAALATSAGLDESTTGTSLWAFKEAIGRFGGQADYTEVAKLFEGAVGAEIRDLGAEQREWRSAFLD